MVISNAIVCDVNGERELDVRIENGVVTELGKALSDEKIIDAQGAYLLPSLIDTNVRLQDASLNAKNIKDIHDEALRGGVGHIVFMLIVNQLLTMKWCWSLHKMESKI